MSTDRELLQYALLAAGYVAVGFVDDMIVQPGHRSGGYVIRNERGGDSAWNPRADDGDSHRLAVALDLDVYVKGKEIAPGVWAAVVSNWRGISATEPHGTDKGAAVRMAVLRVAAEIGRKMS
jgi:hypothetical protein